MKCLKRNWTHFDQIIMTSYLKKKKQNLYILINCSAFPRTFATFLVAFFFIWGCFNISAGHLIRWFCIKLNKTVSIWIKIQDTFLLNISYYVFVFFLNATLRTFISIVFSFMKIMTYRSNDKHPRNMCIKSPKYVFSFWPMSLSLYSANVVQT